MAAPPAYTRLDVDERRRQLLALGTDLFARHAYDELSMAAIAKEAGISKALLYHYFPSKRAYFTATLGQAAAELERRVRPDPQAPPEQQLATGLDAFVGWVEENEVAYRKLLRSAGSVPEVGEVVERVRHETAAAIVGGLWGDRTPPPAVRTAALAWLWFLDGALLDWLERRDISREALRELLLGTLRGALQAATPPAPPAPAAPDRR
jgi:AcrR family transcriptional regulator